MKRDIKSIISVSLAAMDHPSSSLPIGNTLDVPPDVRIEDGVYDSIDGADDSIPLMEGIPLDIFRWSEGTLIEVRPFSYLHGDFIY